MTTSSPHNINYNLVDSYSRMDSTGDVRYQRSLSPLLVAIHSMDSSSLPAYLHITEQHLVTTSSSNFSDNCNITTSNTSPEEVAVIVLKASAMLTIILMAIIGNMLVIISVFRYERLRIIANSFIVSMAMADLLVACLVMTFNASKELLGYWAFGELVCDLFNAHDVLFSTASLQHLCCISVDRYIAVTDPFHYDTRMTKRKVAVMLGCVWGASALISHVPIHLKWYNYGTGKSSIIKDKENCLEKCVFEVNREYGIVSSTISFWLPVFVMVIMYIKIFREARRQEKTILALAQEQMLAEKRRTLALASPLPTSKMPRLLKQNGDYRQTLSASPSFAVHVNGQSNESTKLVPNSLDFGSSTLNLAPPAMGRSFEHPGTPVPGDSARGLAQKRKKIQRENKAARTLGIIMGAFLFCWLPFFTWYLTTSFCADSCHTPPILISILFWVGYFNSALNPLIYALFNRDFREAFRRLLKIRQVKSLLGITDNRKNSSGIPSEENSKGRSCCGLIQTKSSTDSRSPVSGSRHGTSGDQSPVEVHTRIVPVPGPQSGTRRLLGCCCRPCGDRGRSQHVTSTAKSKDITEMQYLPIASL